MAASIRSIPVALTIAGSDCSAGAGLQADLKTFAARGVYGVSVVTCVVAEVPGRVSLVQPVDLRNVTEQLRLLMAAFPVAAVKTGMLFTREVIALSAGTIAALPEKERPWLVVDPVMVASSGDSLLRPDAVAAYERELLPLADLITPNLDEATVLLRGRISKLGQLREAADALYVRYGCNVLLKGGHLQGRQAVDVLRDQAGFAEFTAPFVPGVSTHGTGCTLSAAITAGLARGQPLRTAIRAGKQFVTRAISRSFRWRRGGSKVEALNHTPANHG